MKRLVLEGGWLMYSDEWLKQGFNSSLRMKVSDEVDYRIWSDNDDLLFQ